MKKRVRAGIGVGLGILGVLVVREGARLRSKVESLDVREGVDAPRGWALASRTPTVGASPDPHMVARLDEPMWARDLGAWIPTQPVGAYRYVSYLWAAPITMVGCVLGRLGQGTRVVTDGVVQWRGVKGWIASRLRKQGSTAITFGHAQLYVQEDPSARLQRHEMVHTRQAERLGLAFGPIYWWCQLAFGYARNPLERAARRGARQDSGSATFLGAGSTTVV